ncbi:MAG: cellulose synthase catalytic subunit, partial [Cyanobacteria bacterium P01_H01_bin.153]
MTSAQFSRPLFRPQLATLFMVGTLTIAAGIAIAWFTGNGAITTIFDQLDQLQQHPPTWAMTPMAIGHYFWFWATALMLAVWLIM